MPAAQFDYIAPTTVDEAVAALVNGGRDTRVMAGGTDLIVKIRHRVLFPTCIVSLKRIEGLDAITVDKTNGLTIGATALLADVAAHKGIRRHYPTVAERGRCHRQRAGAQHGHRGGQPVQRLTVGRQRPHPDGHGGDGGDRRSCGQPEHAPGPILQGPGRSPR